MPGAIWYEMYVKVTIYILWSALVCVYIWCSTVFTECDVNPCSELESCGMRGGSYVCVNCSNSSQNDDHRCNNQSTATYTSASLITIELRAWMQRVNAWKAYDVIETLCVYMLLIEAGKRKSFFPVWRSLSALSIDGHKMFVVSNRSLEFYFLPTKFFCKRDISH